MAEYAANWTDAKADEFARYDLNGDGTITPQECLVVEKKRPRRPPWVPLTADAIAPLLAPTGTLRVGVWTVPRPSWCSSTAFGSLGKD